MREQKFRLITEPNIKKTKQLLQEANLQEQIPGKECRLGHKPNLVSPSEPSWGATTTPGNCGGNYRIPAGKGISESGDAGRFLGGR